MRTRSAAVAIALLATLATASAAEAAPGIKTARFVAYVEGKQTTKWNVPRWNTYRDCQGQRWEQATGSETIRFRTKPMRLLAYKPPLATVPQLRYGGWSMFGEQRADALAGSGKIVRDGKHQRGIEPSECFDGDEPTVTDTGPYDCGRRAFNPGVRLEWIGRRMTVRADDLVVPLDGSGDYDNCPLMAADGPDEGSFTAIDQRFPPRGLFNRSQGLIVVVGKKTWSGEVASGHGTSTTTTTFTVRLRRAR